MKITVVNAMAPFVWGGAEELAHHLILNLRRLGHEAELFRIPFAWDPFSNIPVEIARLKALRLPDADRVISMKFPVYLLDADHHSTWLVHQYRQAYDLWDSPYCNIPHTPEGREVRELIIASDNQALRSRERLFTISDEISKRLRQHNDIEAQPLRAPINDPELFGGGDFDGYIVAPGRINASKRQSLLVEAMQYLGADARLIIAGPPESDEDAALRGGIECIEGAVDDQEVRALQQRAGQGDLLRLRGRQALAAAADDVFRDLPHQQHVGREALPNDLVHRLQVLGDEFSDGFDGHGEKSGDDNSTGESAKPLIQAPNRAARPRLYFDCRPLFL